ncbi:hypothetical protein T484DRAFT_1757349 [Baffinella frigidus]|nr:hypothetical protein T484DRAFT_1757349 [Cryptophyta sp. CCMP2293]
MTTYSDLRRYQKMTGDDIVHIRTTVMNMVTVPFYPMDTIRLEHLREMLESVGMAGRICVNDKDENGDTLLHHVADAIENIGGTDGRVDNLAQVLLDAGAEVDAKDKSGKTPLNRAVLRAVKGRGGLSTFANVLIKAGASKEATSSCGATALHYAAVLPID